MNTVAWASAPLLLSEMAPTTVRNMSYGFISTAGEIGSVLAPYLNRIVSYDFILAKNYFLLRKMKICKRQ